MFYSILTRQILQTMQLILIFLFFLRLSNLRSSNVRAANIEENHCPLSTCGNLSFAYPFKTKDTHPSNNCTYINLNCDTNLNTPVVKFPYAGEFFVRYCTNYYDEEDPYIQLYDPGNCTMRRLMRNSNFSSSPFRAIYYADYTFYTCPRSAEQMIGYLISPIDCLSNSTNIVVALYTLYPDYELGYNCTILGTWLLPVNDQLQYEMNPNGDLYLTWNYTSCLACEDKDQFGIGDAWTIRSNSFYVLITSGALYLLFMIIF